MAWIKLDKDMIRDPRLLTAAQVLEERYELTETGGHGLSSRVRLSVWRNALLGALLALWEYADTYIKQDDTLPLTSNSLDAVVGIEGFFDLMPREWISKLDNGAIKLPGYCAKNDLIAKRKRAEDNKVRQARFRARLRNAVRNAGSNATHNKSVTRHAVVTKRVDLDLDSKNKIRSARAGRVQEPTRARKQNGTHEPAAPRDFPAEVRSLAAAGNSPGDIHKLLGKVGITLEQINGWLA